MTPYELFLAQMQAYAALAQARPLWVDVSDHWWLFTHIQQPVSLITTTRQPLAVLVSGSLFAPGGNYDTFMRPPAPRTCPKTKSATLIVLRSTGRMDPAVVCRVQDLLDWLEYVRTWAPPKVLGPSPMQRKRMIV